MTWLAGLVILFVVFFVAVALIIRFLSKARTRKSDIDDAP
jgi:preprotein translocase subunit SecG